MKWNQVGITKIEKSKKHVKNHLGFTLTEVLMAASIFSVGLLGLASMSGTATKGNADAIKTTIATNLAQDKIEEIRNKSYADIDDDEEFYGNVPNHPWARRVVTVDDNDPIPNVKKIKVWVTIQDTNGDDKILVSLTTLRSQ